MTLAEKARLTVLHLAMRAHMASTPGYRLDNRLDTNQTTGTNSVRTMAVLDQTVIDRVGPNKLGDIRPKQLTDTQACNGMGTIRQGIDARQARMERATLRDMSRRERLQGIRDRATSILSVHSITHGVTVERAVQLAAMEAGVKLNGSLPDGKVIDALPKLKGDNTHVSRIDPKGITVSVVNEVAPLSHGMLDVMASLAVRFRRGFSSAMNKRTSTLPVLDAMTLERKRVARDLKLAEAYLFDIGRKLGGDVSTRDELTIALGARPSATRLVDMTPAINPIGRKFKYPKRETFALEVTPTKYQAYTSDSNGNAVNTTAMIPIRRLKTSDQTTIERSIDSDGQVSYAIKRLDIPFPLHMAWSNGRTKQADGSYTPAKVCKSCRDLCKIGHSKKHSMPWCNCGACYDAWYRLTHEAISESDTNGAIDAGMLASPVHMPTRYQAINRPKAIAVPQNFHSFQRDLTGRIPRVMDYLAC